MQPWLIHLGSMARIKVDLWGGAFCRLVSTFLLKNSYSYGGCEGNVKLDSASWMPFTD